MATFTYKCPNCGAPVEFSPQAATLHCDYCNSDFSLSEFTRYNEKLAQADAQRQAAARRSAYSEEAAAAQSVRMRSYHCDNCGAEVVTDATTSATFCYYCHSPVILEDRVSGDFRPDSVIPFKISREEAQKTFLAWANSKSYIPQSFYSDAQLEKLSGIYLPVWLGDADAHVHLSGVGTRRKTEHYPDRRVEITNTYSLQRDGDVSFPDMVEMGFQESDRVTAAMLESIADYDLEERQAYTAAYLSGYLAQIYTVDREQIGQRFQRRSQEYLETTIQSLLSYYDSVELREKEAEAQPGTPEYVLVPAWILTYQYLGKTYVYLMNGQSGKTFGELPLDKKKLGIRALVIAAVILILLLLGGQFIW